MCAVASNHCGSRGRLEDSSASELDKSRGMIV